MPPWHAAAVCQLICCLSVYSCALANVCVFTGALCMCPSLNPITTLAHVPKSATC